MNFLRWLYRWGAKIRPIVSRLIETIDARPRRIEAVDGLPREIETVKAAVRRIELL
jgi:hypothetical protein